MKKGFLNATKKIMLAGVLAATPWLAQANSTAPIDPSRETVELARKVRHELVMLPFYGIFDNFSFRVDNGTVTLMGHVSRPVLKSDAANVIKRIEGVKGVINEIEVLPLSNFDNRIRLSTARAIYGSATLSRYGLGALPSIHIVVKNGEVTLEGVVATEMDRNVAFIRANGVFGVFKVNNHLLVEQASRKKA